MLQNGTITKASANITDSDKQDLSSIVLYFNRYHDLEDLSYLPQGFEQVRKMSLVFLQIILYRVIGILFSRKTV